MLLFQGAKLLRKTNPSLLLFEFAWIRKEVRERRRLRAYKFFKLPPWWTFMRCRNARKKNNIKKVICMKFVHAQEYAINSKCNQRDQRKREPINSFLNLQREIFTWEGMFLRIPLKFSALCVLLILLWICRFKDLA